MRYDNIPIYTYIEKRHGMNKNKFARTFGLSVLRIEENAVYGTSLQDYPYARPGINQTKTARAIATPLTMLAQIASPMIIVLEEGKCLSFIS